MRRRHLSQLLARRVLTTYPPANCLIALSISHSPLLLFLRNLSHLFPMSTEKFFEYAGRPVKMVDRTQFLKAKPEQVTESDVVGPLPCPASASPQNQK